MHCDTCGATILFGGPRVSGLRFCGRRCRDRHPLVEVLEEVPEDVLDDAVRAAAVADCPRCGRPGPLECYVARRVLAAVCLTRDAHETQIVCARCGGRALRRAAVSCAVMGWWSVPEGVLWTPSAIVGNVRGSMRRPDSDGPSRALVDAVRLDLAARMHAREAFAEEHRARSGFAGRVA